MSIVHKLLGIPTNIEEFLAKAEKDKQERIKFTLKIENIAYYPELRNEKYKVKMYTSYLNGSKKTKVFETTSELFTTTDLFEEQAKKSKEFMFDMIRQRNRIRQRTIEAGFNFDDTNMKVYNGDPLEVGI